MIFRALMWIAEEIQSIAEKELYDEPAIHRDLAEAYRLLETRAIDEAEFSVREARIMERLEAAEERRAAARPPAKKRRAASPRAGVA